MDQQSAVTALQALNGMVFDLEKGSTLYIDLAKSNSRSKRSRIDDGKPGSEKRIRESATFARGGSDTGVGSILMPGIGNSAYNTIGYPSTQSYANFEGRALNEATTAKMNNSSAPHMSQNVTPCPTLFVASLGPTCSEEKLIQVFSSCPGFLKLKMQSTYGAPVAFVDFRSKLLGRPPVQTELFIATHQRKYHSGFVNSRSEETYADFQMRQASSQSSAVGPIEDSDVAGQPSQPAFDETSLWLEVAGGKKKGRVYGMGSEAHVIPGSYHVLSPLPPPPQSLISLADQIQQAVSCAISKAIEPFNNRLSAIEERFHNSSLSSPPSNPSDH